MAPFPHLISHGPNFPSGGQGIYRFGLASKASSNLWNMTQVCGCVKNAHSVLRHTLTSSVEQNQLLTRVITDNRRFFL